MFRLFCFLAAMLLGGAAMAVEEPRFDVLAQDGGFELRQYAPVIVAETWVEGDMDTASSKGFRAIADYIFGNNTAPQSQQSSKIAMTAPVIVAPQASSEKVAMTAPVTVQPAPATSQSASDTSDTSGAPGWGVTQRWRVQFVMPSQYTLATLPKPNNGSVTLREVPGKTVAVAWYSGFNTTSRIRQETQALKAWMQTRQLVAAGPAQLARYDPPWTLPFWRRNEVQIDLAQPVPTFVPTR